eukprot:8627975-Alexandrium_andersonii.AAC.1
MSWSSFRSGRAGKRASSQQFPLGGSIGAKHQCRGPAGRGANILQLPACRCARTSSALTRTAQTLSVFVTSLCSARRAPSRRLARARRG